MAAIGGTTVQILRGDATPLRERVDTWHRPGRAGVGAQLMGANVAGFAYVAIFYGLKAAVDAGIAGLMAAQGTIVTITDDHGDVITGNLIVAVGRPNRKKIIRAGVVQYRGEVSVQGTVT